MKRRLFIQGNNEDKTLSEKKERTHCIRIPNSHYVLISSNQFRFRRIKCLVPLNIQYWTAIPAINYNCKPHAQQNKHKKPSIIDGMQKRFDPLCLKFIQIKSCRL